MGDPTSLGPDSFENSPEGGSQTVDINELVARMTRITKEFQYPIELME
jgi:D-tyrosyl-tRNA(Tyr) deacylase